MSSILTNSGAMVALQTLKGINSNLSKTQNDISTGKSVATAKDNAAVWAISKVMESDVTGFEAISSSLSLGESTVAVASSASETVTDLLNKMKEKIVSAQEANVDRDTIQKDITALTDQISAVVGAAQFNGLNLLDNTESTSAYTTAGIVDGSSQIDVLSSLDRSSSGVAASNITVDKQDLGTQTAKAGSGAALAAAALTAAGTATANGAAAATYTVVGETSTAGRTKAIMAGDGFSFDMTKFDAAVTGTPFASLTDATKKAALYVAKDGDTAADVAKGLADVINFRLAEQELSDSFSVTVSGAAISVKSLGSGAMAASAAGDVTTSTFGTVGGGMSLLKEIDVTSDGGAAAALGAIEGLIATSTEASAAFGSVAGRIETQKNFVDSLTDSLKNGISSLVDADMEEASARLQALQTQQQLGIQALSIANQAPQNILSLFR